MENQMINTESNIEIKVEVKVFDMNKNELIDAIASGSKLTKADAGRLMDRSIENSFSVKIEPTYQADGKLGLPKVDTFFTSKETPCSCYEG